MSGLGARASGSGARAGGTRNFGMLRRADGHGRRGREGGCAGHWPAGLTRGLRRDLPSAAALAPRTRARCSGFGPRFSVLGPWTACAGAGSAYSACSLPRRPPQPAHPHSPCAALVRRPWCADHYLHPKPALCASLIKRAVAIGPSRPPPPACLSPAFPASLAVSPAQPAQPLAAATSLPPRLFCLLPAVRRRPSRH